MYKRFKISFDCKLFEYCRLLDFTGGLAGTEEVLTRLKRLAIENICLENISNLVHCIVHLLVLDGYESVCITSSIHKSIAEVGKLI